MSHFLEHGINDFPSFDLLQILTAMDRLWVTGGFTLSSKGIPYVTNQKDDYAVAIQGTEKLFPYKPSLIEVGSYVLAKRSLLEAPNHFLGGWIHEGQYFLDISRIIRGLKIAVQEGRRNKQKAIRELFTGQDIFI